MLPRLLIAFTILVCAIAQPALTRQWKLDLGARRPYQVVVCPDGWVYVTNGLAQVALINPAGHLVATEDGVDGFDRVTTLACSPANLLYAYGSSGFFIYQRGLRPELRLHLHSEPAITYSRMAVAGDGRIFALGRSRTAGSAPLHLLSADGKLQFSFGDPPSPFLGPMHRDDGFPIWDRAARHAIYVPKFAYEFRVYDDQGRPVALVKPGVETTGPRPVRDGLYRDVREVLGVVSMPGGGFAVGLRGVTGRPGDPIFFVDLFDDHLNLTAESIPSWFGSLIGASADGALYFVTGGQSRFTITRAVLR